MSTEQKMVAVLDSRDPPGSPEYEEAKLLIEMMSGLEVVPGKIVGCPKCNMLMVEGGVCEGCALGAVHKPGCRLLLAATCAIAISCKDHGRDVCPVCDACDCGAQL